MDERDERGDEPTGTGEGEEPHGGHAEESDPESAPASDPPPGQDPGEGKQHDL